jgi:hypothetical protein
LQHTQQLVPWMSLRRYRAVLCLNSCKFPFNLSWHSTIWVPWEMKAVLLGISTFIAISSATTGFCFFVGFSSSFSGFFYECCWDQQSLRLGPSVNQPMHGVSFSPWLILSASSAIDVFPTFSSTNLLFCTWMRHVIQEMMNSAPSVPFQYISLRLRFARVRLWQHLLCSASLSGNVKSLIPGKSRKCISNLRRLAFAV